MGSALAPPILQTEQKTRDINTKKTTMRKKARLATGRWAVLTKTPDDPKIMAATMMERECLMGGLLQAYERQVQKKTGDNARRSLGIGIHL